MMEVLVLEYGIEIVVLALVAIAAVGALKSLLHKQLEKIEKPNRKPIYEIASMVVVALLTAGWVFTHGGGTIELYMAKILASYGAMKVIYPLYENFKVRDLVQLIFKLLKERKEEVE